jgi:hypothetical protein
MDLVSEVEGLRTFCETIVDHAELLQSAWDAYESAEEGRLGIEDREQAWTDAQEAAGALAEAVDELIGLLR